MRRMQSDKHAEIEAHLTKNRIAAVDITRVLAALIVMYEHLGFFGLAGRFGGEAFRICSITIGPCSTVFFIFAGYFACRNISWKKAFNNAWWCFAPFMLWCCIAALVMGNFSWHIFGLDSLVTFGTLHNVPINGPLWFMRDLIFLFLLSPLIYRFSRILLPVIFIMSSLPQLFMVFNTHPTMVLSPYALSFFSLGCFLRREPKEHQQRILRFSSLRIIIAFYLIVVTVSVAAHLGVPYLCGTKPNWPFLASMCSLWVVYQIARQIELRSAFLTKLCVSIAPVTFLTFAAHWPLYDVLSKYEVKESPWFLLTPIVTFAGLSLFFFALKRWARPLLHLVAHYKLRPDDLQEKKTACQRVSAR